MDSQQIGYLVNGSNGVDELSEVIAMPIQSTETGERIAAIVHDRKIDKVVIGIPRQMSGEIGIAANEALEFADKLRAQLHCPVETWDERLTTVAANRALRDAGKKTRQTRKFVDQVAAQMILQSYLDRESAGRSAKGIPR